MSHEKAEAGLGFQGNCEVTTMKLLSVETTPSPNCMKLNLDQQISAKSLTLQKGNATVAAPAVARQLLAIDGVSSVFLVGNFITLTRKNHADWQPILAKANELLGSTENNGPSNAILPEMSQHSDKTSLFTGRIAPISGDDSQDLGQVEVAIQEFRGIPLQVRVTSENQQARVSLPERFNQAAQQAIHLTQANYVAERRWRPYEPRFGDKSEVAQMVADELASLIDAAELARRVVHACGEMAAAPNQEDESKSNPLEQASLLALGHHNWEQRLKALQQTQVNAETFPAVVAALQDERNAIRRYAVAILGSSQMLEAVEPLCHVLQSDNSAIVRRTAGDALSDLGDTGAISSMCQALSDRSKLVRWRAARYLNEVGDQTAKAPLRQRAEREEEFEVQMEIVAAIDRIEGNGAAPLPVWMQISRDKSTIPQPDRHGGD